MGENKFELPKKIVTVKYIKRKKGMASSVSDDHIISGGMLSGSSKRFYAPLLRNGAIANVLTKEEKEHLEKITQLNLSVYGDFWKEHYVRLFKDDTQFNLENPLDYISYKILLSLKDEIATSWSEREKKQTYQFVITSDSELINEDKIKLDNKKEAFKAYGKIEDDKDTLLALMKLLTNKSISKDSSLLWLQKEVETIIDSNPKAFLSIVKDSNFNVKLLISKAEDCGYIIKKSNQYFTKDGLTLCEQGQLSSLENAVAFLSNPKNQEVKELIEAKVLN